MNSFFLYSRKDRKKGVTILELVLVLAVVALLSTTSIGSLISYRNRQLINTETSQILSIFNKARSETLASKSQLSYGVRLNSDRIILFPTAFASSTSNNEEYVLHHSIVINDVSLSGGGLDVLFERLTGEALSYGTFRVTLLSDSTQFHTIVIKQTGFIGIQN